MFKTAIVALTVVGCDCDAKMCEYIRAEQPQWNTMAECERALSGHIVRDHHEEYPTVIAVCSVPDQNARDRALAAFDEAVLIDTSFASAPSPTANPGRIETIVQGGRAIVSTTRSGFDRATGSVGRFAKGTFSLVTDRVLSAADTAVSTVKSVW